MRTVQVGFSRPKSHSFPLFSWAIRYLESDNFYSLTNISHAYVRWFFGHPDVMEWNAYEASGSSLHFLGNDEFEKRIDTQELYEVDIEDEGFHKALKFCIKNAGKDYGMKGAMAMAIPNIKRKITGNPIEVKYDDGEDAQFCSEVVHRFLEKAIGLNTGNAESMGVNQLRMLMRSLSESDTNVRRIK